MQQPRVARLTIGRLYNLGNYEHIKYELTLELQPGCNPRQALADLEDVVQSLRPPIGYTPEVARARAVMAKPVADLSDMERQMIPQFSRLLEETARANTKRAEALRLLAQWGGTIEHHEPPDFTDDDCPGGL